MARKGSTLHLTKEGREKLKFTNKLKKEQDKKKYQQNRNQKINNESTTSGKTKQGKPKTKAQMMATKNIKKSGGSAKAAEANKLNRKLGTYGNGDGKDAAQYSGSTTKGRLQSPSENRKSRLKIRK